MVSNFVARRRDGKTEMAAALPVKRKQMEKA